MHLGKTHLLGLFKKIAFFLFLFFVVDLFSGRVLDYLFNNQSSGKYYKITYALKNTKSEILIFGASGAECNYNPVIINKFSKLSCYNVGRGGQDLYYFKIIQDIILNRYKPEYIILDISGNDLFNSIDYDRLSFLGPYYSEYSPVRDALNMKSRHEFIKYKSNLYRYNSSFWLIFKSYIIKQNFVDGFYPKYGSKINFPPEIINEKKNNKSINTKKEELFKSFLQQAIKYKIKVAIVISPQYNTIDGRTNSYQQIKKIADDYNVPFWDLSDEPGFVGERNLFYDPWHLNIDGANLFSKIISNKIILL